MLPKIDGITVCKSIRKGKIDTPVLMLTAKDATEDKIIGLDSGADDYLIKPFEFNELLARIRALLRRPKTVLPAELKISGLTLNPATKKVYRAGKEIILTLKEFRLLEYFMRNTGITLTRDDILNNLWDYEFDSFSNVVDVHVKNLRKKVDSNYKERLFQTVWGVGYKIKN
jgi:DNA-binding response OmpR family regulator